MIQRIQTVYLLLITIIGILMLFFPQAIAITSTDEIIYALSFKGFCQTDTSQWQWTIHTAWLSILITIIPAIALITVNLYKHRILQIRLSIFNIILMIGYYPLFFVTKYSLSSLYNIQSFTLQWPFIIPIITAILTYLAIRAIGKDEALVRSLDRIR